MIVTTSGSGLSVVGGTKALKTLVLEESVASEEALSRDWAVWPNDVGRMYITGRRKDLLEGIMPRRGDVMRYNEVTDGTDLGDGGCGTAVDDGGGGGGTTEDDDVGGEDGDGARARGRDGGARVQAVAIGYDYAATDSTVRLGVGGLGAIGALAAAKAANAAATSDATDVAGGEAALELAAISWSSR